MQQRWRWGTIRLRWRAGQNVRTVIPSAAFGQVDVPSMVIILLALAGGWT